MAGRRLLHGRYHRIPGTAESYYDTVGHRRITRYQYDKRKVLARGEVYEEPHTRQRRIAREYAERKAEGKPPANAEQRRYASRLKLLDQLWYNIGAGKVAGYEQADTVDSKLPRRLKRYRDETKIRYDELESSDLFHRIWRVLGNPKRTKNTGPNSALAHALELMGVRPYDAWWNVGDTPKVMRGETIPRPHRPTLVQASNYEVYDAVDQKRRVDFVQGRLF